MPKKIKRLNCSFCGNSQHNVHKLVTGPSVAICNECIDECTSIMDDHKKDTHPENLSPLESARLLIAEQRVLLIEAQTMLRRVIEELRRVSDPMEKVIEKIQTVVWPKKPKRGKKSAEVQNIKRPSQE